MASRPVDVPSRKGLLRTLSMCADVFECRANSPNDPLSGAREEKMLFGPYRNPFRYRLWGLDVQEMTCTGDDFHRVRGGEPMSVVDL